MCLHLMACLLKNIISTLANLHSQRIIFVFHIPLTSCCSLLVFWIHYGMIFVIKNAWAVELCSVFNRWHSLLFISLWPVFSQGATRQNSAVTTVVATGSTSLLLQCLAINVHKFISHFMKWDAMEAKGDRNLRMMEHSRKKFYLLSRKLLPWHSHKEK